MLDVAVGPAAVVAAVGETDPAFVLLGQDVGLRGLTLGVEGVELMLQAFLGGLAGIHRTAHQGQSLGWEFHAFAPVLRESLKNKNPLQCEPVTALATAESEAKTWPSNSKPSARTCTWT